MQGVTTALVAFLFFCVIFPERVKNRPQFYAAFGMVCLIILLDALKSIIPSTGFQMFAYFAMAMLQIGTILMLFMGAGGLSWNELKGELGQTIEVIRRGGDQKEVIIPLTGQKPKRKDDDTVDEEPGVVRIEVPPSASASSSKRPDDSSVPLE